LTGTRQVSVVRNVANFQMWRSSRKSLLLQ
jgi:hypothetical protein